MHNSFSRSKPMGESVKKTGYRDSVAIQSMDSLSKRKSSSGNTTVSGRHNIITLSKSKNAKNENNSVSRITPVSPKVPVIDENTILLDSTKPEQISNESAKHSQPDSIKQEDHQMVSEMKDVITSSEDIVNNENIAKSTTPSDQKELASSDNKDQKEVVSSDNAAHKEVVSSDNADQKELASSNPSSFFPKKLVSEVASFAKSLNPGFRFTPNESLHEALIDSFKVETTSQHEEDQKASFRFTPQEDIYSPMDPMQGLPTVNYKHKAIPASAIPTDHYNDTNTDVLERDVTYMRHLYPTIAKKLVPIIQEECDKLDYEGSIIYDQYPDKITLDRIADQIFDNYMASESSSELEIAHVYRNPRRHNNHLRDIINLLLLNEIFHRRRCRRNQRYCH